VAPASRRSTSATWWGSTFDLRPKLPRIAAETLVITGAEDFITGPACAAELTPHIPNARQVLVPGSGHFLSVEQPERARAEIESFLTG
jgi:pimeloyl-ACP methyl ester carboxylesterase